MLHEEYLKRVQELLGSSRDQFDTIGAVGAEIARTIMAGGMVHAFGSGHSDMIAREVSGRAGGLVPVNRIADPMLGKAERVEGYASVLLKEYERAHGLNAGEVIIIISNSGRNALPVEICMEAKHKGLTTVALTSLAYSKQVSSRHSSGKKLYELADYVIDNGVDFGDALVGVPGTEIRSGAGSTIMGSLLINMIMLAAMEIMVQAGRELPVLKSMNMDNADEYNEKLIERYRWRLSW